MTAFRGPLYRHIPQRYVDEFRATGSLLVSTLKRCRRLEGPRRDAIEGEYDISLKPSYAHFSHDEAMQLGLPLQEIKVFAGGTLARKISLPDVFLLCLSTNGENACQSKGCFRITDARGFGSVLCRAFSDARIAVSHMSFGEVRYVESKSTCTTTKAQFLDHINGLTLNGLPVVDIEEYFVKTSEYRHENEYRYVFVTNQSTAAECITVKCDVAAVDTCCEFP